MSDSRGTILRAMSALITAIRPLDLMLADAASANALLIELGVRVPVVPLSLLQLRTPVQQLNTMLAAVESMLTGQDKASPQMFAKISELSSASAGLFRSLHDLPPQLQADLAAFPDLLAEIDTVKLVEQLSSLLLIEYLRDTRPEVYNALMLLGLIEVQDIEAGSEYVPAHTRYVVHVSRLQSWFTDPAAVLADLYGWGTEAFNYRSVITRLQYLLLSLGYPGVLERLGSDPALDNEASLPSDIELHLPIFSELTENAAIGLDAVLRPTVPLDANDAGLLLNASATGQVATTLELTPGILLILGGDFETTGGIGVEIRPPFRVQPVAGTIANPQATAHFAIKLAVNLGDGENASFFEQPGLFIMKVGSLSVTVATLAEKEDGDIQLELSITNGQFEFQFSNSDGFLQQVLPKDGIHIDFDFAVGWSNKKGFYFRGGAGLEATFPINKELLGVLVINSVYLAIFAKESGISLAAAASVTLKLGPVTAAIEQMGLQAKLTFPERGGNLGPVNLEIGFKPPKGAGLVIDASAVVGAGFLEFDPDNAMYSGFVYLEIVKKISVTAVGLITTRMPDGSPGFSLLALVAVQFSPGIQLGYGFTLNGIGGILGINRTVTVEVLRTGLRNGTLGSILFPSDPKKNIARIISDLKAVFPPAEGRFVFGPMVILGWGPNELIKLELGIILELPDPIRLLILGRLSLKLPDEKNPVVRLKLDSLGVIEFATGDVSLDAVLYDSEIKGFTITGEMALRANFGASPGFLLSVGGFHPAFKAPPGFPTLQRVAISLATGDNPRLRLAAYMAITTNTVQFGGALEILVKAGDFSLEGQLSFDALIQFDPFGLAIGLGAMIAVKSGNTVLLCIKLDLNLTGPTPWHAWGEAVFKILFFEIRLPIDFKSGEEQIPELPAPVNITPMMIAALQESTNWSTQLPPGEHPLVVFREQVRGSGIMVHPLAMLQVSQRVAPLNEDLYKFGNATLEGGVQHFKLSVDGIDVEQSDYAKDWFAPAHFRDMTDDEKIAADSFEQKDAGIRFTQEGFSCGAAVIEDEMEYETGVSGASEKTVSRKKAMKASISKKRTAKSLKDVQSYRLTNEFLEQVACLGAVGQSLLLKTGNARYQNDGIKTASAPVFNVKPRSFIVVGSDAATGNGSNSIKRKSTASSSKGAVKSQETTVVESYTAALDLLKKNRSASPTTRTRLKIVPL